jgi:hypothetical protein
MLNHIQASFKKFHCEAIWASGLSIWHLLDQLVNFFLRYGFEKVDIVFLYYQLRDVPYYPLDCFGPVQVGLFSYPLEMFDQSVFNVLVGLSLYPILILDLHNFVMRSSHYSCFVE